MRPADRPTPRAAPAPPAAVPALSKRVGAHRALDRFSRALYGGQISALLGPHGAGKRNAGAGLIHLIYLPLCLVSGCWIPLAELPPWRQRIAPVLPTYHLAQRALTVFRFAPRTEALTHWQVLAGFSALMFAVAWITFLRSDTRTS